MDMTTPLLSPPDGPATSPDTPPATSPDTPPASPRRRHRRVLAALAAAVAGCLLLGLALLAVATGDRGPDAGGGSDAGSSAGSAADRSAEVGAAEPAGPAEPSAPSDPVGLDQPALVSTGAVALRSRDVAAARTRAQRVAAAYAGSVTDEETSTSGGTALSHASLTLRVPSASFGRAMDDLEAVGRLVDSSTSSTDVSLQVIDVGERVEVARASIRRIRLLLSRAERIGDVMAIEEQLSQREADLDSLLRRQAHLASQTSMATIHVEIDRSGTVTPTPRPTTGFAAGLRGGWAALRGVASGAATVAGALLPWLPVALLVGVPAWMLARRRATRRPTRRPVSPGA